MPLFGWITPRQNLGHPPEPETGVFGAMDKYGMPAAMAVASFFGGPEFALASTLFNGAKGAISGQPLKNIAMNVLPGLVGYGLGQGLGNFLPPGLSSLYNVGKQAFGAYGLYNNLRRGNYMAGAGSILPYASYFMRGG